MYVNQMGSGSLQSDEGLIKLLHFRVKRSRERGEVLLGRRKGGGEKGWGRKEEGGRERKRKGGRGWGRERGRGRGREREEEEGRGVL